MAGVDIGLTITAVNNATAGLRGASNDVKQLGENAEATANRLKAIQVVITGIILEKTVELGKAFLEVASTVQNVDARVAAWAGGLDNAQKIMSGFNEKLGATGVGMDNLGNAFVKLRAAGVDSETATKTINNLVQGIAAIGGGDLNGKLDAAATAFQRFLSKGVVSSRELNAVVSDTGLTLKDLADSAGVSVTKFNEELKDKVLGASAFLDAFNKAAQLKFGGFAQLLGSTVGGALNQFKANIDEAFGNFGTNSDLTARLAATIQNLGAMVTTFIGSIKQDQVDAFFQILSNMLPIVIAVGNAILDTAKVVLVLANSTAQLLSLLPPDALEYGIIGYVLLGKKGALLGAIIGSLGNPIKGITDALSPTFKENTISANPLDNLSHPINAIGGVFQNIVSEVSGALGFKSGKTSSTDINNPNSLGAKVFGTPAQLAAIQNALKALSNVKLGNNVVTPTPGKTGGPDYAKQSAELIQSTTNLLSSIGGKDQALAFKNAGDTIDASLQEIRNQTQGWNNELDAAVVKIEHSHLPQATQLDLITKIHALQQSVNADTQNAITLAIKLNDLKQQEFQIQNRITQDQLLATTRTLNLQNLGVGNGQLAAAAGTAGGQFAQQIASQRDALTAQIDQYQLAINENQQKIAQNASNPAMITALQQTDAIYTDLISKSQEALTNMTAQTQLQTKFWGDLGNTITNDVGDAVSGLIQGTETWADAGRKIFGDLIDMSVKYIAQLIEIQAYQSLLGSASGGSGGGGFGSLFSSLLSAIPFANGGVIPGGVAPIKAFANGDVVTGPTLFGLAGEAGTEAIMPLTRVGGKLGVRADGAGGGNNYHVTVQAIDTQTGMGFIAKHIQDIDAGLNHNSVLNARKQTRRR